jgi:hypothetical protein
MSTFTEHLRALGEAGLVALLERRADLAVPPPAGIRGLAARAANRASVERALAGADAHLLTVLEAALALEDPSSIPGGSTVARLAEAIGGDPDEVAAAVGSGLDLGLLWSDRPTGTEARGRGGVVPDLPLHPAPGLMEVLGPYPAGLGPALTTALRRRTPQALARLASDLGVPVETGGTASGPDDGALVAVLVEHLARPATVRALLERAPTGARAVLDALTWGPPVGRSPVAAPDGTAPAGRTAVEWLLRHGLLAVGDPQHVVLPREIALVLRDGRTHRGLPERPAPAGVAADPRTVAAESARQAEEAVRLVEVVLGQWGVEQPAVLRSGGLGSRELRRLALRLDVPEPAAALLVEVTAAAGLLADDGDDPPRITPTLDADEWLRSRLPERWLALVDAWLASERAAWLVGTRDERGALRSALDPDLRRPWAPELRTTVLGVLADAGALILSAEQVHDVLRWRSPRAVPALHAVEAVLSEATLLGVLGAGALSAAGRALLGSGDPAAALAIALPEAVDEILLQGDLSGIVTGRPSAALAALIEESAVVESRGAGLTVRFTEASIRSALDGGRSAEHLLADLSRHARNGVPQPLEYLVLDTARRHGQVRVGVASSYLRADDPTLLAGLVEDRALAGLGLIRLAPTVIAAQAPVPAVLAALRERGLAPVAEGAGGQVVLGGARPRRIRGVRATRGARPATRDGRPVTSAASASAEQSAEQARLRRLARVVKEILAADRRELVALAGDGPGPGGPGGPGTQDPVLALALLQEAAAEGREVWLEMTGPEGGTTRRRVRPLRVDAGRVRALDAEREAELTVAVHRIATVTPV